MKIQIIIEKVMQASGLSQHQLAAELNCSQSSVSRMLRNKQVATLKMINKIRVIAIKHNLNLKMEDFYEE